MLIAEPQAKASQKTVLAFCNHFARLKAQHHTFKVLFDDVRLRALMENTAREFFFELNILMQEHLLLECMKLMDPAESRVKNEYRENFTIFNLDETINWSSETKQTLRDLLEEIKPFQAYLKPARNMMLAHYDKEMMMTDARLGAFPAGEDDKFMRILEKVCNLIHAECFGTIFGDIGVTVAGDVYDFRKMIAKASVYDDLFESSTGEKRVNLYDRLNLKLSSTDE